jgi:ferric-dicitrate binding protein FerR (iron transport regulator)
MMDEKHNDLSPEIEERWREWSLTEPAFDENQLRRNLRARIPDRRPQRRVRLVLVAAAASLLAVLIGFETTRSPIPMIVEEQAVVHDPGENVILVLREGGDPIYVAIDRSVNPYGGGR